MIPSSVFLLLSADKLPTITKLLLLVSFSPLLISVVDKNGNTIPSLQKARQITEKWLTSDQYVRVTWRICPLHSVVPLGIFYNPRRKKFV